jgi:glyoxylase-like metal-dependent hydrolase (beta-lactamase superfamily II)
MRLIPLLLVLASCASPAPREAVWTLTPLHVGVCGIGKDHALGDAYRPEERLPFVIYSYLAEGPGGEAVLIDLGPKSLEYTNDMFRRFGFFRDLPGRPDDVVQPHGSVFDHLARRGIARERVSRIVFTHFHADHHGMHDAKDGGAAEDFPNARLNVSKTGWEWNLAKRRDGRWNSYLDHAFGDFLLRRQDGGRLETMDSGEIAPGLEVRYLGGHAVCSRAVRVRTSSGWATITSDDVYRYDLLEQGVAARLHTSPEKLAAATDLLVGLARGGDVLVPLHDPAVWEAVQAAGPRWLDELRPRSERASAGWLASRPNLRILRKEASVRMTPFHAGLCWLGEDHVLGDGHSADKRVPFVLYSFLLESPKGEILLADLGAKSVPWINRTFHRVGFFRDLPGNPDDYVQPHGNTLDQLARRGLKPGDVRHVVYSHLHYDHNGIDTPPDPGMCADFPNAVHHISRAGWEANLATRKDGWQWSGYVDADFSSFMLKAAGRGQARFEDDAVILRAGDGRPLVWTAYLGGHSVCSQAILVRTPDGVAIVTSDDVYHYEFLEQGVMARLHVTPEKLVAATDRLVALAEEHDGILLPIHEPKIWEARERHGDGWLAALRPLSARAVAGYKARRSSLKLLRPEPARR